MSRPLGRLKEQIAADRPETALATAGAMCAEVLQFPRSQGGRNMEGKEAARIVALVSLGKKVILFRDANRQNERAGAIDELAPMLRYARNKQKRRTVPFDDITIQCIAAVALDELAGDKCLTCKGAGQVRLKADLEGPQPMLTCPKCGGSNKPRYYKDEERIRALAVELIIRDPPEDATDPITAKAKFIRELPKLGLLLFAIDFAKGRLLEAVRVSVEETARMAERWQE